MKTAITAMTISGLFAYFLPVLPVLMAVGLAMAWHSKTEFNVINKKTQGAEPTRRTKLRCVLKKKALKQWVKTMLLYNCIVLSVFVMDQEVAGGFISMKFELPNALTKCAAIILIGIEAYCIDVNVKQVRGVGIIGAIGKAAGFIKKARNASKGIYVIILLLTVACSPIKRHYRLVQKYPYVHTQDTVTHTDSIIITVPGFRVDTVFNYVDLVDTVIIVQDGVTVRTWGNGRQIGQSVVKEPETHKKTVKFKVPVQYYKVPLPWYRKTLSIIGFCIVAAGAGWFLNKTKANG